MAKRSITRQKASRGRGKGILLDKGIGQYPRSLLWICICLNNSRAKITIHTVESWPNFTPVVSLTHGERQFCFRSKTPCNYFVNEIPYKYSLRTYFYVCEHVVWAPLFQVKHFVIPTLVLRPSLRETTTGLPVALCFVQLLIKTLVVDWK